MLVTLDGSHFSEAILGTVAIAARSLDAEVELFSIGRLDRVHDTPSRASHEEMTPAATATGARLSVPLPSQQLPRKAETREQAMARVEGQLRTYLLDQAKELPGVKVTVAVDIADDPGKAIIERARQEHVDVIAMATHGRSGLSHLLTGSVCEQVIRSGVAPVLVLRP
jgi:nucleotide-binding universal stress UspA family protein